jgi:uncharacterized protein
VTDLLTYIAKALVDKPDLVELRASDAPADPTGAPGGKIYELKVAPEDVGKVIGRDGRTVNAMRTLLAAAAQKKGEKARLEILDDRRNAQLAAQAQQPPPSNGQ